MKLEFEIIVMLNQYLLLYQNVVSTGISQKIGCMYEIQKLQN